LTELSYQCNYRRHKSTLLNLQMIVTNTTARPSLISKQLLQLLTKLNQQLLLTQSGTYPCQYHCFLDGIAQPPPQVTHAFGQLLTELSLR
jgi:hypothetical protein